MSAGDHFYNEHFITRIEEVKPLSGGTTIRVNTSLYKDVESDDCNRCQRYIYPLESMGPVMGHKYHKQCFRCHYCDRLLDFKTYRTNLDDLTDKQIYCVNHNPKNNHHNNNFIGHTRSPSFDVNSYSSYSHHSRNKSQENLLITNELHNDLSSRAIPLNLRPATNITSNSKLGDHASFSNDMTGSRTQYQIDNTKTKDSGFSQFGNILESNATSIATSKIEESVFKKEETHFEAMTASSSSSSSSQAFKNKEAYSESFESKTHSQSHSESHSTIHSIHNIPVIIKDKTNEYSHNQLNSIEKVNTDFNHYDNYKGPIYDNDHLSHYDDKKSNLANMMADMIAHDSSNKSNFHEKDNYYNYQYNYSDFADKDSSVSNLKSIMKEIMNHKTNNQNYRDTNEEIKFHLNNIVNDITTSKDFTINNNYNNISFDRNNSYDNTSISSNKGNSSNINQIFAEAITSDKKTNTNNSNYYNNNYNSKTSDSYYSNISTSNNATLNNIIVDNTFCNIPNNDKSFDRHNSHNNSSLSTNKENNSNLNQIVSEILTHDLKSKNNMSTDSYYSNKSNSSNLHNIIVDINESEKKYNSNKNLHSNSYTNLNSVGLNNSSGVALTGGSHISQSTSIHESSSYNHTSTISTHSSTIEKVIIPSGVITPSTAPLNSNNSKDMSSSSNQPVYYNSSITVPIKDYTNPAINDPKNSNYSTINTKPSNPYEFTNLNPNSKHPYLNNIIADIVAENSKRVPQASINSNINPITYTNISNKPIELNANELNKIIGDDKGFGAIRLTIHYDELRTRLSITIHEARNLRNLEKNGLSDPYARVYLTPDEKPSLKRKTKIIKNNLNPIWQETFDYSMTYSEAVKKELVINLKDERGLFEKQESKFLGEVGLKLKSIDIKQPLTRWFYLQPLNTALNHKFEFGN